MITEKRSKRIEKFAGIDIYPVISSEFTCGRDPLDILKAVADGGAKIVQMREKHRTAKEAFAMAEKYREICSNYDMLLIIDDYAAIAADVDADGVHLGQDDLPLAAARELFPDLIIGASTHNEDEAVAAQKDGCDYLNIGPIFATQTKSLAMPPLGLDTLDRVKQLVKCPFTVMGGIKQHHLPELVRHGARRIAMVTEITAAEDVTAKVTELRNAIITAIQQENK